MQQTMRNNTKVTFDMCALTPGNAGQMHQSELPVAQAEQQERMKKTMHYTKVAYLIASAACAMGMVTENYVLAGVTFGANLLVGYINHKDYKDAKIKNEILTNEIGKRQEHAAELAITEIPGRIFGIDPMSAYIAMNSMKQDKLKLG